MGKVYVKKSSGGPAGLIGDLAQSILGGSKQDVIDEAAKRQLANFDYSRGATPLYGDKDAGSLGPKDRHGNQQCIPANAAGRHDMDMEGKLLEHAGKYIPISRLISGGLGALSAIDSLANAQPGQSGLGMLHNAATRGYLSHIGARSMLDPSFAGLNAWRGRRKLERTNPHSLPGAPPNLTLHPTVVNALARTKLNTAGTQLARTQLAHGNTQLAHGNQVRTGTPTTLAPYSTGDVEVSSRQPYTHEMIPHMGIPESHTIAPDMTELIQNPTSINGEGVMENMSPALENQYAYLQEFDKTPLASPTGYQTPSPSGYTIDDHQRLLDEYGGS